MDTLSVGFAIIAVFVAVVFLLGVGRVDRTRFPLVALGTAVWMAGWHFVADRGLLARFDLRPPPFAGMFVAVTVVSIWIGASRLGAKLATLPLAALVGVQAFRLPLELLMHQTAEAGVMPPQMTYGGWNYDIVTGITALLLAPVADRVPRWVVRAWSVLGSILLAVILGVALASTPAVAAFGPERLNTFVAEPFYVWLPTVLVVAAFAGHIVVFRATRR
jgi:hypothetical protein